MTPRCDNCGKFRSFNEMLENGHCIECHDVWCMEQAAYWKPIYDAEKRAGLLKSDEQYRAEMIDAGRGHLLRR